MHNYSSQLPVILYYPLHPKVYSMCTSYQVIEKKEKFKVEGGIHVQLLCLTVDGSISLKDSMNHLAKTLQCPLLQLNVMIDYWNIKH